MNKKYLVYLVLFVVGAFGGNAVVKWYLNSQTQPVAKKPQQELDTQASDFSLVDLEGSMHSFAEWDGKVRILNFWATWCPPCRKETPMFVELQEQYADRGLQFIGVAIDDPEKVKEFVDTYGVNYPILIGEENAAQIAERYGDRLGALPYTVVINRQGKIVHAQAGEMLKDKTEQIIAPLLQ